MTSTRDSDPGSRLPALGSRGGGWVAGQMLLIALVLLSALVGHNRRGGYAVATIAAGGTLVAVGLLLLAWAGVRLGGSLTPFPAPRAGERVKTRGPYALVRHPMYGGVILFALGWSIAFATVTGLVLSGALSVFLDLKARREEAWLRERVAGYDEYLAATPRRLVPLIY
jgi:protein-S-isoprenylcysteine O-methyltransferase Ste14